MEIRQLRYFLSVYKHGNITKAAKELYISQQTLSRQVRAFEDELGVPLFVRSLQGVEPTQYAQALVQPAKQIVKMADGAAEMLGEMCREAPVTIRLGMVKEDFNQYNILSPKMIFDWERAFPQMTLDIQEYDPEDLERMLLQEELDLAYTLNSPEDPELCRIPLDTQPAYILMSRENPLAEKKPLTAEDLAEQRIVEPKLAPFPPKAKEAFLTFLGRQPDFFTFGGGFAQTAERVRANEGILISSRSYCLSQNLEGLAAIPFPNPEYVFQHYLSYKKGRELSLPARQLIRDCQAAVKKKK